MGTELWGTFSVSDHRRTRPFVADVLLYDRLAIPVPDGDEERQRWSDLGRDPGRQQRLLEILGSHGVPIPWTRELHEQWSSEFTGRGKPSGRSGVGIARARMAEAVEYDVANLNEQRSQREDPESLAQGVTRMVLANSGDFEANVRQISGLPKVDVESVPAYGSLRDFQSKQSYHLETQAVPGGRPVLMFEWQVFVPTGSELSDEGLLERAVILADSDEVKQYRTAFHAWRRDMVLSNRSDEEALLVIEDLAGQYRRAARGIGIKTRVKYGLGIFAASAGVAALVVPLSGIAAGAAALGVAVMDTDDREIDERLKAGAFLHETRRYLRHG